MQVSSAELRTSDVDDVGELHYYLVETAPVGTSKFLPAAFVEGGISVMLDLAGRVVEPELHEFATADEYDAFMKVRHPREKAKRAKPAKRTKKVKASTKAKESPKAKKGKKPPGRASGGHKPRRSRRS
jgi:hypothetical protein